MSILFAHFVYLHYSYRESCTCVLPAAVSCGPAPSAPANGRQIDSGTTFGSTVTYTCNVGYTPQGDNGHTCMANGEWSGRTPICNRKLLAVLILLLHGIKSPSGQWYCIVMTVGGSPGLCRHRADKQQVERQYTCSALLWINYAQCVQSIVTYDVTHI